MWDESTPTPVETLLAPFRCGFAAAELGTPPNQLGANFSCLDSGRRTQQPQRINDRPVGLGERRPPAKQGVPFSACPVLLQSGILEAAQNLSIIHSLQSLLGHQRFHYPAKPQSPQTGFFPFRFMVPLFLPSQNQPLAGHCSVTLRYFSPCLGTTCRAQVSRCRHKPDSISPSGTMWIPEYVGPAESRNARGVRCSYRGPGIGCRQGQWVNGLSPLTLLFFFFMSPFLPFLAQTIAPQHKTSDRPADDRCVAARQFTYIIGIENQRKGA